MKAKKQYVVLRCFPSPDGNWRKERWERVDRKVYPNLRAVSKARVEYQEKHGLSNLDLGIDTLDPATGEIRL